jgi:5-hydroxyisourate hydrolase-like protein (transthyretin family)
MNRACRHGVGGDWSKPAPFKNVRVRHPGAVLCGVVVLVVAFVCTSTSAFAQSAGYRVAGIVVNDADGTPLAKTRVSLAEVQDRRKAETVITGADGRFEFRNVPAGKFSLEGGRRNFLITTYQWHEGFSTAIVTGAGLETENLVLRMIPFGSIAGKIIDEAGEPVRAAHIRLYMRNRQFGRDRVVMYGSAQSDDEGKYEFMDLIPAEYFVSVRAHPWYAVYAGWIDENGTKTRADTVASELNVAYPVTFYNGATESEGATPIQIEKGARVAADIHLNAVPAVYVTVKAQKNPENGVVTWPSLERVEFEGAEQAGGEMIPSPDGTEMLINGLAPGNYFLGEPSQTGMIRTSGRVEVAKDGQVIEGKSAAASATIKVKLKTARGEDLPQGLNLSLRTEQMRSIAFEPAKANGEAIFENVPPGKYSVMVNVSKAPQYTIGRISQQGGAEVEGHDVTVGEGATVEVDATLMAGIVSVEGVVKKNGKPLSGVMVALVPKDPRTHLERFRRDQSDMDGTFMVGGILPGTYTLIAVEDGWGFAWMKEGVLEKYLAKGQQLNIGVMMNNKVVLPEALEAQAK